MADPGEDPRGPTPPSNFYNKLMRPEGRKKKILETTSPHPLSKFWMTGPPLSQGLDPALSNTKYHKILETLSLNKNVMIFYKCFIIVPRD